MTWAVKCDWRFKAIEVIKETEKMVFYKAGWRSGRETRAEKSKFLDWRGDHDTALSIVAKLTSAMAEYERRREAAAEWYRNRKAEVLAQVDRSLEGQNAEERLDAEHESAVANGDAPKGGGHDR